MNNYNKLITMYHPMTATPFRHCKAYTEIIPDGALKPYIRCFWGTEEPLKSTEKSADIPGLVIPDTCMDIIFSFDSNNNLIDSCFCAIDENSHFSNQNGVSSIFAIRFYAWSAVMFTNDLLTNSKNKIFAAEEFFPGLENDLLPMLESVNSLNERAAFAENYLLKTLDNNRINSNMMNAVYDIISAAGTIKTAELAAKNAVSKRQLERIFCDNMGISPKSFSSLVRYQMLWQELCFRGGNILDLTEKYGYSDQSHLLNDFKKRHSMTPRQALDFKNNVAFLQYKPQVL